MGYGTLQPPVGVVGSAAYQQIGVPAGPSKIRSFTLRATLNTGTSTLYAKWRLNNGSGTTIDRCAAGGFPVTYQDAGAAPDLETNVQLPTGWYFEVLGLGITFSIVNCVEDDA